MTIGNRERASQLHAEAQELSGKGDTDAALAKYAQALSLDPSRANTLYNIGLIHKYRSEWRQSLEYNRRSLSVEPGDEASSGFRYGDVVLHDGAPVGYRRDASGREYAVFNVLELFTPSRFSTWEADLIVSGDEDLRALETLCAENRLAFEDWSRTVRRLCRACSEGRPHDHHDREIEELAEDDDSTRRHVALAGVDGAAIQATLRKWTTDARRFENLRMTLDARKGVA